MLSTSPARTAHLLASLETPDRLRVTLDDRVVCVYDWSGQQRHPYLHPLHSPRSTTPVTNFAPFDHRWHLGLWWTWKHVNGVNFWENNGEDPEGRSVVTDAHLSVTANGAAQLTQRLDWRTLDGDLLLTEQRELTWRGDTGLPGAAYVLDWHSTWTAGVTAELTATPFPAVPWGGYAGLNYRPARALAWNETIVNSEGSVGQDGCHGMPARWCAYAGNVDGDGHDSAADPASAGVLLLHHPSSDRHPLPWYAWSVGADHRGFGFLAASPLMRDALHLDAGQTFTARLRVVPFDGRPDAGACDAAWHRYAASHPGGDE
ncbi:PmoA family protein [Deinococcus pimensis]|uniref:DUF6807 domain-containing protein n=1 Tax=Deinococcus pimensis TaxID=309888 RepID=UPI0004881650|nr:PmoA family protein [Deinococcus pimensis]